MLFHGNPYREEDPIEKPELDKTIRVGEATGGKRAAGVEVVEVVAGIGGAAGAGRVKGVGGAAGLEGTGGAGGILLDSTLSGLFRLDSSSSSFFDQFQVGF